MAGDNNDNHRRDDPTGDTTDDGDPRDSPDTPLQKRCIVDVTVEDSDWEDEGTLPGLGMTTHCRRNPQLPVNPRRKQRRRVVAGPNVRATVARRRKEGMKCLDALAGDLDAWELKREEHVHELAEKHGMKLKQVRRCMLALSTYVVRHKPSTYNAKISRIMVDLNKSQDVGECYTMPQVKLMVADDPSMLEGEETRTHANNLAAAADARRTMDRLMTEIASLAEHVGMIGLAMFSCGHVHDKSLPVTIQSWGALGFFLEVLKRDPMDVSSLFELWAVTRERGMKLNKNRLLTMQQEGTALITMGLPKFRFYWENAGWLMLGTEKILGITKCAMTYEGYIDKLVRGKGVGLVNWPEGVDFKRMSLQSAIGLLEKLLDSLKCGITQWKVLTAGEKQQLIAQYEEMVEQGEVKAKTTTRRNHPRAREPQSASGLHATKPKHRTKPPARNEEIGEDEDDSDAPPPPKPAAKPKRPTKPSVAADDTGEDNDKEPPARKTAAKRKHPTQLSTHLNEGSDDADSEPPSPKALAKWARTATNSSAQVRAMVKSKLSLGPRRAKSKPSTVRERLLALVEKGQDTNDRAKTARKAGKDKNAKGGSKKKGVPEEEEDRDPVNSASQERPRLKPLYRKKTVMEGPSTSSDVREGTVQDIPDLPPTSGRSTPSITTSSTATGSGRPNTVRGSRKGPPGMKVWRA
ncbi:hypothetical protein B0H14DRAFT_3540432 [Mycena olivaceomarginata]|nr:hypothetical protein B0H14DRAFT_3540432 [Mycena olivaceomarginata]